MFKNVMSLQGILISSPEEDDTTFEDTAGASSWEIKNSPPAASSCQQMELGLNLTITPSLLEHAEMIIRGSSGDSVVGPSISSPDVRHDVAQGKPEKIKASSFPASRIVIGTWKRVSRHECDIMAKCYFAKKKLVWEFLEGGLKSKMEIQWAHIEALRAELEGCQGVLEVELNVAPQFYLETNPQPKKHTQWKPAGDFTGGQAFIYRRHHLEFPPGILNKHYRKLLQSDSRLYQCSLKAFQESPFFELPFNTILNFSFDFQGATNPGLQAPQISLPVDPIQMAYPPLQYKESTLSVPVSDESEGSTLVQDSLMQFGFPQIQNNIITSVLGAQVDPFDGSTIWDQMPQASSYDAQQANCSHEMQLNLMEGNSSWMLADQPNFYLDQGLGNRFSEYQLNSSYPGSAQVNCSSFCNLHIGCHPLSTQYTQQELHLPQNQVRDSLEELANTLVKVVSSEGMVQGFFSKP